MLKVAIGPLFGTKAFMTTSRAREAVECITLQTLCYSFLELLGSWDNLCSPLIPGGGGLMPGGGIPIGAPRPGGIPMGGPIGGLMPGGGPIIP